MTKETFEEIQGYIKRGIRHIALKTNTTQDDVMNVMKGICDGH